MQQNKNKATLQLDTFLFRRLSIVHFHDSAENRPFRRLDEIIHQSSPCVRHTTHVLVLLLTHPRCCVMCWLAHFPFSHHKPSLFSFPLFPCFCSFFFFLLLLFLFFSFSLPSPTEVLPASCNHTTWLLNCTTSSPSPWSQRPASLWTLCSQKRSEKHPPLFTSKATSTPVHYCVVCEQPIRSISSSLTLTHSQTLFRSRQGLCDLADPFLLHAKGQIHSAIFPRQTSNDHHRGRPLLVLRDFLLILGLACNHFPPSCAELFLCRLLIAHCRLPVAFFLLLLRLCSFRNWMMYIHSMLI